MSLIAGLGKTLEAIAIIMLHPRTAPAAGSIRVEEVEDEIRSEADDVLAKRRKTGGNSASNVGATPSVFKGLSHWDDELKLNVHEVKVSRSQSECIVV
jgi:hypothetical protein